jgi:hypothetical protein
MVKWIRTYTGAKVNPVQLRSEDVNIIDIAHSLSNLCRFTGHVRFFYPVALHSVLVSRACSPKNRLWGLLHDAAEPYINDIASPVKCQREFKIYRSLERKIQGIIAGVFGLPKQIPEEVNIIDHHIVQDEGSFLFNNWELPPGHHKRWTDFPEITPREAEKIFLKTFNELTEVMQ